jgi:hypothetical protein
MQWRLAKDSYAMDFYPDWWLSDKGERINVIWTVSYYDVRREGEDQTFTAWFDRKGSGWEIRETPRVSGYDGFKPIRGDWTRLVPAYP